MAHDNNRKLIDQYLIEESTRKLHIGCGSHLLSGWLNSDYPSQYDNVITLDATGPYPFEDGIFDYIFMEHLIEHWSFATGEQMLKECCRVMNEEGKIRISTPDLRFLFALLSEPDSELHGSYIRWSINTFIQTAPCYHPTFVINHFMRAWRHLFIYDERTLGIALARAGFTQIKKCVMMESEDPILRNLENECRLPAGFLKLESLVFEGTKKKSLQCLA